MTDTFINSITPEHIRQLVPYSSAKRELLGTEIAQQSLWLNANESPYNSEAGLNTYPDFQSEALIKRYADYAGIAPEQVLATRGADEGIELLVRTFCVPGQDSILINPPTYGMYAICAKTSNVAIIKVPLTDQYRYDVSEINAQLNLQSQQKLKILFICSPANPTGERIKRAALIEILQNYQDTSLVVVDEAYIEFSPEHSAVDLINDTPNLVILRTLSKAFALAGIRCGFVLAQQQTINTLRKVIAPYPMPAPIEQIALNALSADGLALMRQQVAELNRQKSDFISHINDFACVKQIMNSDANFVLLRVDNKTQLLAAMMKNNILLRDQSSQPTLDNCIRITIGEAPQMLAVLNVFKEVSQ
ncbi:MAG: histidinol-phosphate aminotransferase [Phenylobacterium sp.]|jgi:histidinol-phosphate aminotransferase